MVIARAENGFPASADKRMDDAIMMQLFAIVDTEDTGSVYRMPVYGPGNCKHASGSDRGYGKPGLLCWHKGPYPAGWGKRGVWMKGQTNTGRRRAWARCLAGGGIVCMTAAFLACYPLTVVGKGKNVTPDGSLRTEKNVSDKEDIRFGNRAQRYPVTDTKPGGGNNWIKLSLLETTGTGGGLPDMGGKKPQTCYIKKQTGSRGGFSSPACSYDVPVDWTYGSKSGEPCLDVYWPDDSDAEICTHITENRMFPEGVEDGWKEMQKQIRASAGKTQGVKFSEFRFERYRRSDGRELLFYSFLCSGGDEKVRYAVAYVTGESYLAEFIGSCPQSEEQGMTTSDYAIEEITRYMAASYEETKAEKNFDQLKYRPYTGYENWAYEDLHNPFALASELYAPGEDKPLAGEDRAITFISKEWEDLIRLAVGYHYDMSDAEWDKFSDRSVYASDLAWITEVTMTESPIPGRDTVSVGGLVPQDEVCASYNLTSFQDIAVLPNLEELTLEIGSASDYEVLKTCPSLEELTIVSAEPMEDIEWICDLPNLKSLTLRISMFSRLNEMGYEKEGGTTFGKKEGTEGSTAKAGNWEDTLKQCTSLPYLDLERTGMMDFEFLKALPDLYTFRLSGEERDSEAADSRRAAFGEGTYPQIKCLVVDEDWIRNPA